MVYLLFVRYILSCDLIKLHLCMKDASLHKNSVANISRLKVILYPRQSRNVALLIIVFSIHFAIVFYL